MNLFCGGQWRQRTALVCVLVLLPGAPLFAAPVQQQQQAAAPDDQAPAKLPADQLDSLVSPIALYPDPLLSQMLVASTYPLEIIQLQQWLTKNPGLKDKALSDAVSKQNWDPSIQAMAGLPDAVKQLADNISWTTDLGNAFLAQQGDVMDAVQRMRKKAKDAGNLKTNEQMKVETKTVESKTVVVVEQANPQVVYVPSYNPTVVYGPPVYPYPPIVYPPPPPPGAYIAGAAISFGVGVAMGAMWSGGWGYHCGWGGGSNNNIVINNNNNFVNNSNRNYNRTGNTNIGNSANVGNRTGNSTWQHNPQHRGGAPYSDRSTASKYGGTARGDSLSQRQAAARQTEARNMSNNRAGGGASAGNLGSNRAGSAGVSDRSAGAGNRASGGGGDRVGSRETSASRGGSDRSAFSGSHSGSSARASSQRGSSSFGGGGGGGGRGGGGRRR